MTHRHQRLRRSATSASALALAGVISTMKAHSSASMSAKTLHKRRDRHQDRQPVRQRHLLLGSALIGLTFGTKLGHVDYHDDGIIDDKTRAVQLGGGGAGGGGGITPPRLRQQSDHIQLGHIADGGEHGDFDDTARIDTGQTAGAHAMSDHQALERLGNQPPTDTHHRVSGAAVLTLLVSNDMSSCPPAGHQPRQHSVAALTRPMSPHRLDPNRRRTHATAQGADTKERIAA